MKSLLNLSARILIVGISGAAACTLAGRIPPAYAQSNDSETAGRALFDEGLRLFQQEKYGEACPKFEESLARFSGIGTRGKLAECYEKLGRTASAWALYREVAVLTRRAGDSVREKVATDRANALEPKLARVAVALSAGANTPGLVVKRSGQALAEGEFGSAIAVDPGEVLVEASAPGRKPWSTKVQLNDADSVRVEVPALDPALVNIAPAPRVETRVPDELRVSPSSGWGWQRTTGLVTGGVGIAALAVGGYFGLAAKSTYDGAFNGNCTHSDNTCNAAGQADTKSARSEALASTILAGTGAGLLATGAILFFTAPKRASPQRTLSVAPHIDAMGARLTVWGNL